MRNPATNLLLWLPAVLLLSACESKAPAPKSHEGHHDHAAHKAPAEPKADSDAPVGPRLETGSFLLEVAPPDPTLGVGKSGEVAIALEGRGEWHVNQEYPIRIDLAAGPGAGLQHKELVKGDAKVFTEDEARFVAALEPSEAGEHEVTCNVSFAMCTDENCVLEKRTVATLVKVE